MTNADGVFGVAVVGMAGKFPGAADINELWNGLCAGQESIRFFRPHELDPSLQQEDVNDPGYVPARGVLQDAEAFDAAFFGISPREAELMDPQHRVFLEVAWSALEAAGHDPASFPGLVGVYAGMANNSYYLSSVLSHPERVRLLGAFQVMLANEKDFLATRVSHKLDLRGPSISLYTGCSTSLVAVCQAFHALMSFQCDMALAGGVCITVPQNSGYVHREGGIESQDGHCRPFDRQATGTVFSNGVGVVVLRRLEDALEEGDHIHAVLLGAAVNNDGAAKIGFAAPSVRGQADAIANALAQGNVDPASIGFVEAHGTATQMGDPVEVEGLRQAFGYPGSGTAYCALGSVKGNFGHLLAAAGVTGLIKAVLAIERGMIPPTLHFREPNPSLDLERSPFFINVKSIPWPGQRRPRRAGVSSFGIGGTNAHVVLEEAPTRDPSPPQGRPELLVLSAKSPAALERATTNLAGFMEQLSAGLLSDLAFTLQVGRRAFAHRKVAVVEQPAEASTLLRDQRTRWVASGNAPSRPPDVVFAFPGMGAQYDGMGHALYSGDAAYRAAVEECREILLEEHGSDWSPVLLPFSVDQPTLATRVDRELQSVFVTDYALARMWMDWGIQPKALIGHSVGELVAACIAETFDLRDALRFLVAMGAVAKECEAGGMLAVRLGGEELDSMVARFSRTCVAARNSFHLHVVSGPESELRELSRQLADENVPNRFLPSARGFHSPLMDDAVPALQETVAQLHLRRPRIPWISTVTGKWIDHNTATDPGYWARLPREQVRFREAIATVTEDDGRVILEVGPGTTLATCARQVMKRRSGPGPVSSLPDSWGGVEEEWRHVLMAAGRLWLAGASLDWNRTHPEGRRRVAAPTYPFERTRHWLPARRPNPH